jgi:hypothetical protein
MRRERAAFGETKTSPHPVFCCRKARGSESRPASSSIDSLADTRRIAKFRTKYRCQGLQLGIR